MLVFWLFCKSSFLAYFVMWCVWVFLLWYALIPYSLSFVCIKQVFLCDYYTVYIKRLIIITVYFKLITTYFNCIEKLYTFTLSLMGEFAGQGGVFLCTDLCHLEDGWHWWSENVLTLFSAFLLRVFAWLEFSNLPNTLMGFYKVTLICGYLSK